MNNSSMCERIAHRCVLIADIAFGPAGCGWFTRWAGESRAAFTNRVCSQAGDLAEKPKVLRYRRAMARGAIFPPVFLAQRGEAFEVMDGWHRVTATALLGASAISADVLLNATDADANACTEVFYAIEDRGIRPSAAMVAHLVARTPPLAARNVVWPRLPRR
jgi:hypothetical protein